MNFDVAGQFKITRNGAKNIINKKSLEDLRDDLEAHEEGLSTACGCYVFAKRAGKGIKPWYVGRACKLPMAKEALNAENRGKYNDAKQKEPRFFFKYQFEHRAANYESGLLRHCQPSISWRNG